MKTVVFYWNFVEIYYVPNGQINNEPVMALFAGVYMRRSSAVNYFKYQINGSINNCILSQRSQWQLTRAYEVYAPQMTTRRI